VENSGLKMKAEVIDQIGKREIIKMMVKE